MNPALSKEYREPERELPVAANVDVVVLGGGFAGLGAAISAARYGCKTLLVERYGFLGGTGVSSLVTQFIRPQSRSREMDGLFAEILVGLRQLGAIPESGFMEIDWGRICYVLPFDPESLKYLLDCLTAQAGVENLFHTLVAGACMDGDRITGVIIENKRGRQVIAAKVVVDATGDGDVAVAAGASYEMGRPGDHLQMAVSSCYRVIARGAAPDSGLLQTERGLAYPAKNRLPGYVGAGRDERFFVPITALGVDGTDPWQLTQAEMDGRRYARESTEKDKARTPALGDIQLMQTGVHIGVRSTRRITGDYVLTGQDVLSGRKFPAAVAQASFYCDVFEPDKPVVTHKYLEKEGDWYEIPYQCLLPRNVEGLLVAGRCISSDYLAQSSLRLMHTCMAMGEAAGVAAGMAATNSETPREIAVDALRQVLQESRSQSKAPAWCPQMTHRH